MSCDIITGQVKYLNQERVQCWAHQNNQNKMSRPYRKSDQQPGPHSYVYNIRITSVKMKVKFQCRMKIEHQSEALTTEVPVADGCFFVFNQDCTLAHKNGGEEMYTLSINLVTSKGAKYIAGLAVISHQELSRAADVGSTSKITIALSKCLDPEAVLQFVVRDAVRGSQKKPASPARDDARSRRSKLHLQSNVQMSQIESRKIEHSPPMSPRGYQYGLQHATRSEINLPRAIPANSRPFDPTLSKAQSISKVIRSRSKRNITKSRERIMHSAITQHQPNANTYGFPYTQRDRMTVDYVEENRSERDQTYKESYRKLKDRLRRQEAEMIREHEKRATVESNEAATKIEVLKYRLKCEELQKNVSDKSGNIKKLEQRIEQLQRLIRGQASDQNILIRRDVEYNNIRSFSTNQLHAQSKPMLTLNPVANINPNANTNSLQNQSAISVLESKVVLANRELEELKSKILKISRTHNEKQNALVKEIDRKNARIEKLEQQIAESRNSLNSTSKTDEHNRILVMQKQKIIGQLQKQQQEQYRKLSECEKTNKILQRNIEQLRSRTEQLNRNLNTLTVEKNKLADQVEQEKNKANMSQFSANALRKNVERLESQLQGMGKIKEKYHDTLVEVKRIEGERRLEQKNYQNLLKQAGTTTTFSHQKHKQQFDNLNRKNHELESKLLQQTLRVKQLQTHLNSTVKNQLQNYRKNNQKLQRDCQEYRNGERALRKQQLNVESKFNQISSEVEVWKNKYKSLENVAKLESDRFINELNRMKGNLQQQMIAQLALKEKNQALGSQIAITSNKLAMVQEKYQKDMKQYEKKLQGEINKNNKLQQMMKKYEQMGIESKDKQKQLRNKIEQYGENESQYGELIKRYEHQLGKIKNLLALAEEKLTTKQEENQQLSRQVRDLTQKHSTSSQKLQQLTYSHKNTCSQLQKWQKEHQKLQLQHYSLKQSCQSKDKTIQTHLLTLQQQSKAKQELKEQLAAMGSNYDNVQKQYDRFKEHVYDVLIREFTGVDGLDVLGNFVIKGRDERSHVTLKDSAFKNYGESPQMLRNSQKISTRGLQQTKITKSVRTINYQSQSPLGMLNSSSAPSLSLSHNDIITILNQFSKQSKTMLNRMIEQYRVLEKELEYSKEGAQQKEGKFGEELAKAEQNIHQLEEEISKLFVEKDGLEKKLDHTTNTLEQQIYKLREQLQRNIEKLQESIFTANGIRMQKQTQREFYQLKISQLNTTLIKLQTSLANLNSKYAKLEDGYNKSKYENEDLVKQNRKYKEECDSKDKKVRELEGEVDRGLRLVDDLSGKNKGIVSQVAELEILLAHQKEKNGRNMEIISQEEKKLNTTKDFLNSLIKQKEALVKQQISNGHKIIELQSAKLGLQTELQTITLKLQQKISQLGTQRQHSKRLNATNRQLQAQLATQKQTNRKQLEQHRQKQHQLATQLESQKSKETQAHKQLQTLTRELQQHRSNKQLTDKLHTQQLSNHKKQIERLQEEINQLKEEIKMLNAVQQMTARELDTTSRSVEEKSYEINSYREIQEKLNAIRETQEQNINSLLEQIKQKQQQLYNTSNSLYLLEQRYKELEQSYRQQRERMDQEYGYKYDNMCEDYETRLDEMERDRDYIKGKLVGVEEEAARLTARVRELEEEESRSRAANREKVSRMEEERNAIVAGLKAQVKKLTQQIHRVEAQIKKKDGELDRLKSTELVDKNTMHKLQSRLKQSQIKVEQLQSSLHSQQQGQKKKDLYLKQYEQSVASFQWMLEREIKKELQNVTRAIVSSTTGDSESKRRYTDAIKDVETRVSRLVGERIGVGSTGGRGMGN